MNARHYNLDDADPIRRAKAEGAWESWLDTRAHSRRAFIEKRHAEFERLAAKGREVLDASDDKRREMLGGVRSGDTCLPYMKGLDALECLGERLDEVATFRAECAPQNKRLRLSPWERPARKPQRNRTHSVDPDAPWIAKLRAAFPDKPWKVRDAL